MFWNSFPIALCVIFAEAINPQSITYGHHHKHIKKHQHVYKDMGNDHRTDLSIIGPVNMCEGIGRQSAEKLTNLEIV
jgi:hypothetical protein